MDRRVLRRDRTEIHRCRNSSIITVFCITWYIAFPYWLLLFCLQYFVIVDVLYKVKFYRVAQKSGLCIKCKSKCEHSGVFLHRPADQKSCWICSVLCCLKLLRFSLKSVSLMNCQLVLSVFLCEGKLFFKEIYMENQMGI